MPINISRVGVRKMGPNSFHWCTVTTGTNWSIGSSVWTWGRTSSLWGWRSSGTGCPGRLWGLLLWRYSRPSWTRSCAACCRWPCFGRRVGLGDPQRSLPTPTILWFCALPSRDREYEGWRACTAAPKQERPGSSPLAPEPEQARKTAKRKRLNVDAGLTIPFYSDTLCLWSQLYPSFKDDPTRGGGGEDFAGFT